ncbi:MAG: low specificity L-threonine aldolase [Proteobacteria bacterium]|nr:low specificity L-threonine aldolase [Pseudomonadota bacterium]MBS0573779.1 low specificity L-threonine aldolase [Pseudomonadota bacterium]
MEFASDNTSGAAPEVLAALVAVNEGYAPSYGIDDHMARVTALVREAFEAPAASVHLVATGTAANALSAALLCPQWGAIYCHAEAHIEADECGAPEFFIGGGRTAPIAGDHGKITPGGLRARMALTPQGGVHHIQHGMLSLTNLTEAGTLYRPGEVASLAAVARGEGMKVHMDGSRLSNALAASGAAPADMTWRAGVDVLSLGATKNGCLGVEAVVIFDPAKAWEFELRRKRAGHLFSKHRFLAAQMAAYLEDGLWLRLATQANRMAARLAEGLADLPGGSLVHPCQGNIVFASFARGLHRRATEAGAHYYLWPFDQTLDGPDDAPLSARFVCSWSTTGADVDRLLDLLNQR